MSDSFPGPHLDGKLRVTVHDAKELASKDLGKMDPFVTLAIIGEKHKTKTHERGGKNPRWEQSILFNLKNCDIKEVLHIQVFNEDLLSNDKVGRADIPLRLFFEVTDRWFQIVDFENFKKIAGYIRMTFEYTASDGRVWTSGGI
jgi:Ca2+-dependent lipid-binding protein